MTTARKYRRRVLTEAVLAAAATAAAFCPSLADAAVKTWTNGSGGAFESPGNWGGGVPGASDSALFDLGDPGYTVTFGANHSNQLVTVDNDQVTFALAGFTYSYNGTSTLASAAADSGALTVNNGTFTGTVFNVGLAAGGAGTLAFGSGANATFASNLSVGVNGGGTLLVSSGADLTTTPLVAIIGSSPSGNGFAGISGSGSTWTASSITVGNNGAAVLNVTNQGSIVCGSAVIGSSSTAVGNALVSGTGSRLHSTGSLIIGREGLGNVTLSSFGTLGTNSATLGASTGGAGTVVIGSSANWMDSGVVRIGAAGAGTLIISPGSSNTEFKTGSFILGSAVGGSGLLSHGALAGTVTTGSAQVGGGGAGTVNLFGGGRILSGDTTVAASAAGQSSGTITISGNGSAWISTGQLVAGSVGRSYVSITNGGTASFTNVNMAANASASSEFIVSGLGSSFNSAGAVNVGGVNSTGGTASLAIDDGARFTVASSANLRLFDLASLTLDNATLSVGQLIKAGGQLNWNSGTIELTGSGGAFLANGGPFGEVTLLSADRSLIVTNVASVGQGGLLHLDGGRLTASVLEVVSGGEILMSSPDSRVSVGTISNSGRIVGDGRLRGLLVNNSAGELRLDAGDRITIAEGDFGNTNTNDGRINLFGGTLDVEGELVNSATGRITGRGVLTATRGIVNDGTITFSAGLSDIDATITNNSASKAIVTGGSTSTFFQSVTNNSGSEFRVSTGSTAVFLGDVTGLDHFTGAGVKIFEGSAALGRLDTTGGSVVESGGTLVADYVRESSLAIRGQASINSNGSAAAASRVGALVVEDDGVLDLNDNDILIAGGTSQATVEGYVANARNGGAWDGPGLTSSAARTNPNGSTGLGVLRGQEYIGFGNAVFDGFSVSPADVLVKYTWNGDTNFSGDVNFDDYVRVDVGFNTGLTGWSNGDFNYSGAVNFDDYVLIDVAFNTQSGTLGRAVAYLDGTDRSEPGREAAGVTRVVAHFEQFGVPYAQAFLAAVPEPSSLLFGGAVASATMLARRRRA